MTIEQIIGVMSAAFVLGLLIGGVIMDKLHSKASKATLKTKNINLN